MSAFRVGGCVAVCRCGGSRTPRRVSTSVRTPCAAGQKFVAGELKQSDDCLKKVAKDVLKDNAAVTTSTAAGCVKAFRKINDTRALGKSRPRSCREDHREV
jgi:hypothetical protein